jgi:hypothetical protein
MTSASSSINNKKARFLPLFNLTLKQKWTTGLLIAIILFFTLPIPVMMTLSSIFKNGNNPLITAQINMIDWSATLRYIIIPLMSILAVVISCAMFGYLKNKVPVDFYHSLPIRRGRLYINQLISGYFILILPLILMFIATFGVLISYGVLNSAITKNMLLAFGECIVYTLFFYALSTLVGMASGLTSVQLVLTGTAIFIIPFLYVVSLYFLDIFNENMWVDWYCNEEILSKLSLALRFTHIAERLNTFECIVYLILSAALFIGGYAVYMHRKSERAGMSVVFHALGEVIKYLLVFPMTLLGGLLFYLMMNSFAWTVFGMICGGLLTFMLTNTILNKTAKAMFRGWKGLCIFGGAMALSLVVLTSNLFGINSNIPNPKSISKVEVNLGDSSTLFEFRNPEVIKALYEIYTEGDWRYPIYEPEWYENATEEEIKTQSAYYSINNQFNLRIVFHQKVGLPIAKSVTIYNKNAFADQLKIILDSEEFKSQYIKMVKEVADKATEYSFSVDLMDFDGKGNISMFSQSFYRGNNQNDVKNLRTKLLSALALDMQNVGYDYFQQTSLGYIRIYNMNYDILFPIYANMKNVSNILYKEGHTNSPIEKQTDMLADCIDKITVTKLNTAESKTYSDKNKIKEIISALSSTTGNSESSIVLVDHEYVISYTINMTDDNRYEDKYIDIAVEDNLYEYEYEYICTFLFGKVPAFITNDFGK